MGKRLKYTLLQKIHKWHTKDIQVQKRCTTSLTGREVQIKTTIRYYLITVSMVITKKQNQKSTHDTKAGEGTEKLETLCTTGEKTV